MLVLAVWTGSRHWPCSRSATAAARAEGKAPVAIAAAGTLAVIAVAVSGWSKWIGCADCGTALLGEVMECDLASFVSGGDVVSADQLRSMPLQ